MDLRFNGTITTLSPVSHNSDESVGTDTKFRRMTVFYNGRTIEAPFFSGNAFRGLLRRTMARQFCDSIDLGKISDKLYYCFFTGGSLTKGATQSHIDIGKKRDLRANIPFLSLLGSAVGNSIIPGKLNVDLGMPIAAETAGYTGIKSEVSIYELTTEIFYTRRDDLEDKEAGGDPQQMKYNIECLTPGTVMTHGFSLQNINEIEAGCFAHGVKKMQTDRILGGKSGTGHGKVCMEYEPEWPAEKPYLDFLAEKKTEIVEYVRGLEKTL